MENSRGRGQALSIQYRQESPPQVGLAAEAGGDGVRVDAVVSENWITTGRAEDQSVGRGELDANSDRAGGFRTVRLRQ